MDAQPFVHVGVVDVAADDAIDAGFAGLERQRFLEAADDADGVFHLVLGPGRERPVGEPEPAADPVDDDVDAEREAIGPIPYMGEPFGMPDHYVELVQQKMDLLNNEVEQLARGEKLIVPENPIRTAA